MSFKNAAEREFGRVGVDVFSLCSGRDFLPAEIATGLDADAARRIAAVLESTGASISVVRSRDVEGVRAYAEECWPDRSAGHWRFREVDGMILTPGSLNARSNVNRIRERHPEVRPWHIEIALNHQHPTNEYSRHALRVAREMGADLAAALHGAYPERRFVVEYWEEMVSFHQRADDASENDEPPTDPLPPKTFCEVCRGSHAYTLCPEADPEFPQADWGRCENCGEEVLVRTWKIRAIV